jgi:hypothetical protein
MSQFQPPAETIAEQPRTTSKMAVASLVCSLIFFCPITTLLGPLLGLIAIATMGPTRKGRGLAAGGILIGAVLTGGWAWGGWWFSGVMKQSIEAVMEGPHDALTAGFAGDMAGFRAGFHGAGTAATDAEVTVFIEELRSRYGDFVSSRFNESSQPAQPQFGQPSAPFPYLLTFASGDVAAEAEIVFADQRTGEFVMKLGYIEVPDAERGTLRFPATP